MAGQIELPLLPEMPPPSGISLSPRIRIERPDDCPLTDCPALSSYEREVKRREAIEEVMSKALAREEKLVRRNEMLSAEFEHRTLNNIQMIASILNLQSRVAHNKEAADSLRSAAQRLVAVGRIQRRLHASNAHDAIELKSYFEMLGNDIGQMMRGGDSTIHVEGEAIAISTVTCTALGLIINELVTNALKYARGKIGIRVEGLENDMCRVSVTDEGSGLPANFLARPKTGMGFRIIESLVKQIDGRLEIGAGHNGTGGRIDVLFPHKAAAA